MSISTLISDAEYQSDLLRQLGKVEEEIDQVKVALRCATNVMMLTTNESLLVEMYRSKQLDTGRLAAFEAEKRIIEAKLTVSISIRCNFVVLVLKFCLHILLQEAKWGNSLGIVQNTPSKSSTVSTSDVLPKSNLAVALRKANSASIEKKKALDTFVGETNEKKKKKITKPSSSSSYSSSTTSAIVNANDTSVLVQDIDDASVVNVDEKLDFLLDFIVVLDTLPYFDSQQKVKYVDITRPIRMPNREKKENQSTGVYYALEQSGNLKSNVIVSNIATSSDINDAIKAANGGSKYFYLHFTSFIVNSSLYCKLL